MKKSEYISYLTRYLTPYQIAISARNPTKYMTTMHIKLHYVALRRLGYNELIGA